MIDFINVKKGYADKDILKDATIRVNKFERIGLVGPNGAGKSTLFNMIIGETEPDKGEIVIPKNMRMGYLKQQIQADILEESLINFTANTIPEFRKLHNEIDEIEEKLTLGSNDTLLNKLGELQTKFESLGGYEITAKAEAALCGLGFQADQFSKSMSAFSGGWQMRAGLAQTLIVNPDILLLDEPSNYLDVPAIEWMQRYLKNYKGTLLLISHDRYLLNSLTNITLEINAGLVNRYPGNYDYYVKQREIRFQSLHAAKDNQNKLRNQLEKSINRFRAKSTKASQVQSWIRTIEKMEQIDVPDDLKYSGQINLPPAPASGAEMMRLENLGHTYDEKNWILKNINLQIERGDKIGFIGYNGMGKTTLLRIIAGQLKFNKGKRVVGHKAVIGYQAQESTETLLPNQSVWTIVKNAAPDKATDRDIRNVMATFGFQGDTIQKMCQVLSGGEKIRLAFARIFINPPNLLILDEPTTHLDIAAREGLQEAVKNYDGTVCLVSHDIEFIRKSVSTIISMTEQCGIKKYYGDYDYYTEKTGVDTINSGNMSDSENQSGNQNKPKTKNKGNNSNSQKRLNKQERALERQRLCIEEDIGNWEKEKSALLIQIDANEPDLDYASLNQQLESLENQINSACTEWDSVTAQLEILR